MESNKIEILSKILKCGYFDLDMLEDIQYDLNDIIDNLIKEDLLSLGSIISEVFYKGISELQEIVEDKNKRSEIETDLKYLITILPSEEDRDEIIENFEQNLSEEDNSLLQKYGNFEWKEDVEKTLFEFKNLCPEVDIEYEFNYLDTHIWFKEYSATYKRLFSSEIEEIEYNMGFNFENY